MKNKQILSKNAENLGCRYRDQNQDDLLTAQGTFSPAGPLRPWKTKRMHKVHSKKCRCVYQCYFGAGLLLLHLSNHHKLHVGLIQCRGDHQLFKRLTTRLPGENSQPQILPYFCLTDKKTKNCNVSSANLWAIQVNSPHSTRFSDLEVTNQTKNRFMKLQIFLLES